MEPRPVALTPQQAARLLQVNVKTIYRMLEAGEIPFARKIGGSWRIAPVTFYRWIEGRWPQERAEGTSSGA